MTNRTTSLICAIAAVFATAVSFAEVTTVGSIDYEYETRQELQA